MAWRGQYPRPKFDTEDQEAVADFLVTHGVDNDALSLGVMVRSGKPVAYWQGLLDEFGDLGGNCKCDGTRVRTPWVPPPECWSTEEVAAAFRERQGKEELGTETGEGDDDQEEY